MKYMIIKIFNLKANKRKYKIHIRYNIDYVGRPVGN